MTQRKILQKAVALLCAAVPVLMPLSVSAESQPLSAGVYAQYVDETGRNTVPTDENGSGDITMPDGTAVTVNGATRQGCRLVIDPIAEPEALDWIDGVTAATLERKMAFHIYYVDDEGRTSTADGVTVTAQSAAMPEHPAMCSLTTDGRATALRADVQAHTIAFTVNGAPYYVIGGEVQAVGPTGPAPSDPTTVPTTPQDPNSPTTGDMVHTALWLTLILLSGGVLAATLGRKSHQVTDKN